MSNGRTVNPNNNQKEILELEIILRNNNELTKKNQLMKPIKPKKAHLETASFNLFLLSTNPLPLPY